MSNRYLDIAMEKVVKQEVNSVLDKIRAGITAISITGQVDEHTMFIRTGEQVKQMALDVIDKYNADFETHESEVENGNDD